MNFLRLIGSIILPLKKEAFELFDQEKQWLPGLALKDGKWINGSSEIMDYFTN